MPKTSPLRYDQVAQFQTHINEMVYMWVKIVVHLKVQSIIYLELHSKVINSSLKKRILDFALHL